MTQSAAGYALCSVSDKRGLDGLGRGLAGLGYELLATGGSAAGLRAAGVEVREVSDYTGFPELMGGRLKTLHPKVQGGILGRRGVDDAAMEGQGIRPINLVAVNLYPFARAVADPAHSLADAVEQIDIGGPTMLRAAAKNHGDVVVLVDPDDYEEVLDALRRDALDGERRYQLAAKAFAHSAAYDIAISNYFNGRGRAWPAVYSGQWHLAQGLRYGENPHQRAALYHCGAPCGVAGARQLQGRELSHNNINDAAVAMGAVRQYAGAACVIVKHACPCGAAMADSPAEAYGRAFAADPESAFGGILAFNRPLDADTARAIVEQFAELVIAPQVEPGAARILQEKKNLRLLCQGAGDGGDGAGAGALQLRSTDGGLLVQGADDAPPVPEQLRQVSARAPDAAERADMLFAWQLARWVKSNAVVYACGGRSLGIGGGQTSRVQAARLAAERAARAGMELRGAAMASDAFLPFADSVEQAAAAGVRCIIQPGGSVRDAEVTAAADRHGMAMLHTGIRHFCH